MIDRKMVVRAQNGGPNKIFRQGEQYAYNGTITKWKGCSCRNNRRQVVHYIVQDNNNTYLVSQEYASANTGTGPAPSIDDRLENMGDAAYSLQVDSEQATLEQNARMNSFKMIM